MGVQELKHAAKLREWSEKVAECRTSGKGVRAWCADRGVSTKTYYHWEKLVVMQAAQNNMLPSPTHNVSIPAFVSHESGGVETVNPDHRKPGFRS